jgi:hypothetical protein
LPSAFAPKWLEPIAGWNSAIVEFLCDVELLKFAQGYFLDVGRQFSRLVALMNPFGGFAAERKNHLTE